MAGSFFDFPEICIVLKDAWFAFGSDFLPVLTCMTQLIGQPVDFVLGHGPRSKFAHGERRFCQAGARSARSLPPANGADKGFQDGAALIKVCRKPYPAFASMLIPGLGSAK